MNDFLIISYVAMFLRIVILGAERIYLKKLDKFDSLVVSAFFSLIASISLIPLLFFIPNLISEFFIASKYSIIASLSYTLAFYLYVLAISIEDASLIAPLYNSSIFFIFVFGSIFLQESVTIPRIIGGILIFGGMFILYPGTVKSKIVQIRTSKGSIYMIIGSVFLAIGRTIDDFSVTHQNADPRLYAFLIYFYVAVYSFILVAITKRDSSVMDPLKLDPKNLALAGIANGWAYMFLLIALQAIDLTVAVPLSLLSVFVTAFLAKYVLGESVTQRIPGTILIYIGALALFF